MDFVRVGSLAEIPEGEMRAFDLPSGRIAVAHVEARMFAFADECTHQAFPLSAGEVRSDGTLECVWHGARFDCLTGAVQQGPATDGLMAFPVRIQGDRVLVGPPEDAS